MEIFDVYDKYKNLTGKRILRSQYNELTKDEYALITYVAIFNQENELLIQKRQANLDRYPNLWDISVSGFVTTGETSNQTIERKLLEELGYTYDFSLKRPHFTVNFDKCFADIYIENIELDINSFKLNYSKVQNVTWATKEEILLLIEEGKFIPYAEGFIEMLFFNKNQRGIIKDNI